MLRGYEPVVEAPDELTGIDINNPNVIVIINDLVLFLNLDQGKHFTPEKICGDLPVPKNYMDSVKTFLLVVKRIVAELKSEHPSIRGLVYETARSVLTLHYLILERFVTGTMYNPFIDMIDNYCQTIMDILVHKLTIGGSMDQKMEIFSRLIQDFRKSFAQIRGV